MDPHSHEKLPALVAVAAAGIKGSTRTVQNGPEGVDKVLIAVVQGMINCDALRMTLGDASPGAATGLPGDGVGENGLKRSSTPANEAPTSS
jgi:hypothetical protein